MPSTVLSTAATAVNKTSKGIYAQDTYRWKTQTSVNRQISGSANSYKESKQESVIKIGVLF